MSNEVSIFKNQNGTVAKRDRGELSGLAKSMASASMMRRIQANTNGTFKRIVNGEQAGKALRGEINIIVVNALPKVSRIYYAKEYDPNAEPTLPDCWSNLGDRPESEAGNPQSDNCADCPQNVKGSGKMGSRACRYQRRLAVLVEGDDQGDLYQFQIPAKSLFGKGVGNVHPFESYVKFLIANGESPDNVVTNVSFDDQAETMELLFTPIRIVTDEEAAQVAAAQASQEADMYTRITVAQTDKAGKEKAAEQTTEATATKHSSPEEPDEDEEVTEPKKRSNSKSTESEAPPAKQDLADVIAEWEDD